MNKEMIDEEGLEIEMSEWLKMSNRHQQVYEMAGCI